MVTKTTELPEDKPVYTDMEVVGIMETMERIYALDDAIYNQEQLRRPETYIKPLREIRKNLSDYLTHLTSKAVTEPAKEPEKK